MTVRDLTILGCSSQQPTRKRNHGAYLLRWNNEGLLFDPGEGTQRQFIFAEVAPPCVNRIFISHFHGDHSIGLGSMLLRLNLDKVKHPIHCYYPASGQSYFDKLRYGSIYRENINVVEHPIDSEGVVFQDDAFTIEAAFLDHGVDNLGYRITEPDIVRYDKEKIKQYGIKGMAMKEFIEKGIFDLPDGKRVNIEDVSYTQKGDTFSIVLDTKYCENAIKIARDSSLFLCESTYLESERVLADKHLHLTAKLAAQIAKEANAQKLILTHFSARYLELSPFEEEARTIFPNTEAADDLKRFPFERRYIHHYS